MAELQKVHHIVSGGLKHGKYYRVYVTQVNKDNVESMKSIPSIIRIGDIEAPPTPTLVLDTSQYKNGCNLLGTSCDIFFKWGRVSADDLDHYTLYIWKDKPDWFKNNGKYSKDKTDSSSMSCYIGSGETSFSIGGQRPGSVIYAGIQSADMSHNVSDVYIIRVVVEDQRVIGKPSIPIYASPNGPWAIRVWTTCPNSTNIESIEFFRDGVTKVASVLFHASLEVSYVDALSVDIGLSHFYRYRYVYTDGRTSPFSDSSKTVSATVIDTRYLDKVDMEAYLDAWVNNTDIKEIETLKKNMESNAKQAMELARRLDKATEDYEGLFNNYKILAKNFEVASAKVTQQEKTITALQTQIKQNADAITLRATKSELNTLSNTVTKSIESKLNIQAGQIQSTVTELSTLKNTVNNNKNSTDKTIQALRTSITQNANAITLRASKSEIDSAVNQVRQQMVAQIQIQADRITSLVSSQNGAKSQITQLDNAIRACVKDKDVQAMVAIAVQQGISTAVIEADRIVVKGQLLLQGNARLVGRLSTNYVSLVDSTGRVIWGSDTGTVQPKRSHFTKNESWTVWKDAKQGDWQVLISIPFTPNPPVNFNGMARVHASVSLKIGIATGGGFDYQTSPNMFSLQFADSVTGQNHNTGAAPTTEFDNRGCLVIQTKNNVTSYVPVGGGWKRGFFITGANRYENSVWWTNATVSYTGSCPIGKQIWFYLYARETPGNRQSYNCYYLSTFNVDWECV